MSTSASPASFRERLAAEWPGLSEDQSAVLADHYERLVRWNRRLNLTRIEGIEEAIRFHYCESLFLSGVLPPGPLRILDIGSGAGFPGIPIAVLRSDCHVDLAESDQRKAVFLREATRGLTNAKVLAKRSQDCAPAYDWIVSRAVAPREVLATGLAPKAALLISEDDATGAEQVVKVPWGNRRVVGVFHVKHTGPCSTCNIGP